MSHARLRSLSLVLGILFTYVLTIGNQFGNNVPYFMAVFVVYSALLAAGALTAADGGGFRVRRRPAVLCIAGTGIVTFAFLMIGEFRWGGIIMVPPIVAGALAINDLLKDGVAEGRRSWFVRAKRWIRPRPLIGFGSTMVLFSFVWGYRDRTWITASNYVSWDNHFAEKLRSVLGISAFWLLTCVSGISLVCLIVALVRRRGYPRWLSRWVLGSLVLSVYAEIDAGFAGVGLNVDNERASAIWYFTWLASEIAVIGWIVVTRLRAGRLKHEVVSALTLLFGPLVLLANIVCAIFVADDFTRLDTFTIFYPGAALLLWGYARFLLGEHEEQSPAEAKGALAASGM